MKFSGFIFAAEDQHTQQERYNFIFKIARYLDENNYTALWTPERHFQKFGGSFPNPSVLSAALAATTSKLQIRAGSVVAVHHHAVRIAEEWALVDQISQGRTGVCFAAGWHMRDFVFYPENYQNRKENNYKKIQQVRDLWAGNPLKCTVNNEQVEVITYPQPYQKEIPMWLVFSSDPKVWVKAGELGLNVLALLNGWDVIKNNIKCYREAREKNGYDPQAGIVTIGLHTFIDDDNEKVRKIIEKPLKGYLSSFLLAKTDDKRLSSEQAAMNEDEKQIILAAAFQDLFENRALLGNIEKCKRVVDRLQSIGVNEIAALVDFGVEFDLVFKALDKLTLLKNMYTEKKPANGTVLSSSQGQDDNEIFNGYYNRV